MTEPVQDALTEVSEWLKDVALRLSGEDRDQAFRYAGKLGEISNGRIVASDGVERHERE